MTEDGCQYKNDSDAICNYLASIVIERDFKMMRQFEDQNNMINHNYKVLIDLLTNVDSKINAQNIIFGTEIAEIKKDITYLKERSSKQPVRKRIALAVGISLIVFAIITLVLKILGYL